VIKIGAEGRIFLTAKKLSLNLNILVKNIIALNSYEFAFMLHFKS